MKRIVKVSMCFSALPLVCSFESITSKIAEKPKYQDKEALRCSVVGGNRQLLTTFISIGINTAIAFVPHYLQNISFLNQ